MAYTKHYSLLTVGTSLITSGAVFIGDARTISASLLTVGASVVTLQGSNADGSTAAIPENTWSTMTVFTSSGIYAVQPGARWARGLQAASSSSATLTLVQNVDT